MKNQIKYIILLLILILGFLYSIYIANQKIEKQIELEKETEEKWVENSAEFNEVDEKIELEDEYLSKALNNYLNIEKNENIIPNGFSILEKDKDILVIKDENNNSYVWVPCSKEKIKKTDFSEISLVPYDECYDENYEEFISSITKYGGFFISQYEIGLEEENLVSKPNTNIYTGYSDFEEANNRINQMYLSNEFKNEIINGLAYDITLSWIIDTNDDVSISDNKEKITGKSSYNNIYDILDSNTELTNEKSYFDFVVYRGFIDVDNKKNDSVIKKNGKIKNEIDNRYLINEDGIENIGIRTILYKK